MELVVFCQMTVISSGSIYRFDISWLKSE